MTLDVVRRPRLGAALLGAFLCWGLGAFSVASANDLYVQVGSFSDPANVRIVRGQLERQGFPVAERLVSLEGSSPSIVILVGPYARVDQARYSLNKLKQKGWKGILRRYATSALTPQVADAVGGGALALPPALPGTPAPTSTQSLVVPPRPIEEVPPPAIVAVPEVPAPVVAAVPVEDEPGEQAVDEASPLEARWSGVFSVSNMNFAKDGLYAQQKRNYSSLALAPELYLAWNDGDSSLLLSPFVRAGDHDDERNQADIRELMWLNVYGDWELRAGVGRVFWGVTESMHLVDVINQMDLVEGVDGEDKLGQPMLQVTHISDIGTFGLFAMPYFRERTYPGLEGRLRGPLVVDHALVEYESDDKEKHLDWAVRWAHYIGDVDIGLSHFSGTNREPGLRVGLNGAGAPVLIPRYELMDQTGIDIQALWGDWIWKLEAISRKQMATRYTAAVAGFEYTLVGIFGSYMDLGLLSEYLYDERDAQASTPYADDWMVGARWVFNDVSSTEVLVAYIKDAELDESSYSVELSRRLAAGWTLGIEARGSSGSTLGTPLYPVRDDNYFLVDFSFHF